MLDRRARLRRDPLTVDPAEYAVPTELDRKHAPQVSTQQALGRFFVDLTHVAPPVAARVVTVSPDVASATNLGSWINRVGIWNMQDRPDWFSDDAEMLIKWREGTAGQHIELGIAEGNLAGLLAELGATWSRWGQRLLPVGTIYDPFVTRALEQWSFGIYGGGQSILVGTPSAYPRTQAVPISPIITPSSRRTPHAWLWTSSRRTRWTMLHALQLESPGHIVYFRSAAAHRQSLAAIPPMPPA